MRITRIREYYTEAKYDFKLTHGNYRLRERGGVGERETETETHREKKRETDRQRERQTERDRQRQMQIDRVTEGELAINLGYLDKIESRLGRGRQRE